MAIKFARDTFQPSTGQTYFIPPISKQRNSCSPKNCFCRYWILERGPALICCEQRPITKSLRLTLCPSQSKADNWTYLLLSQTICIGPSCKSSCMFVWNVQHVALFVKSILYMSASRNFMVLQHFIGHHDTDIEYS